MDDESTPQTPLVEDVRRAWEHLAGPSARFSTTSTASPVRVLLVPTSRLCPPGWCGLVTIDGATMATAPDDTHAQVLQRGLDDLLATSPTAFPGSATPPGSSGLTPESSSRLAAELPVRDVLGPTDLAYLPTGSPTGSPAAPTTPPAAGDAIRTVDATDPLVQEFLAACSAADAAEAALDSLTSPAFVLLGKGTALAVAGYELWPSGIAHLCVLTHPAARGTGLARIVAGAATDHALRAGLLPQWRARPLASRRVAHALGYRSLGHQVSFRLAV